MPEWFIFVWLLFLAGAAGGWIVYLRLQQSAMPKRQVAAGADRSVLLELVTGGRAGMMNYTWPLLRFRIDEQGITFEFPFSTGSMAWRDVTRAVLVRPVLPIAMGVEFQLPRTQPLTVWASRETCETILGICADHGVAVVRVPAFRV